MKPQSEKLENDNFPTMKFFTPDLFRRINSENEEEANRADVEWDEALLKYRDHCKGMRFKGSLRASPLTRLRLHDAELIEPETLFGHRGSGGQLLAKKLLLLVLQRDHFWYVVTYFMQAPPRIQIGNGEHPFTNGRLIWLYDELDKAESGFVHRILFSNGSIAEIPFLRAATQSLRIDKTPLARHSSPKATRVPTASRKSQKAHS